MSHEPQPLGTPAEPDIDDFRIAIDLERTREVYLHGTIMVWMTWLRVSPGKWDPCMVLTRDRVRATDGARCVPCVVPLSRAWAWDDEIGDIRGTLTTAVEWCPALGLNPMNPRDVFRVKRIVNDHLHDLLTMPPMPRGEGEVHVADMIVTDAKSGKVWETEVRDVL